MYRVFQGGSISAYEHVAMIKTHYRIADTLDHCLVALATGKRVPDGHRDRPVLRIQVHRPVESIEIQEHRRKDSENETLSTHSSLNDVDDDTTPSKWEAIKPNRKLEKMERS
jgi:hypothetical protein